MKPGDRSRVTEMVGHIMIFKHGATRSSDLADILANDVDDDGDDTPDQGNAPSVTAIPKTKTKKSPPEGDLEPEPTA